MHCEAYSASRQAGLGGNVRTQDTLPVPRSFAERRLFVRALIREKGLKRIDGDVLLILLSFRNETRNSCWCAVGYLADHIGCHIRTVQRALARLTEAGLIEQVELSAPDPDEHNRTGWRIVFVFLAPGYQPGPGPDRRPPKDRKRWARIDQGGNGVLSSPPTPLFEHELPPTPMAPLSPEPMASLSSNTDGRKRGGERNQNPPISPVASPSGSCLNPGGGEQTKAPTMQHVRPEDLRDVGRLLDLHQDAVRRGLVTASERDQLRFVAMAEHAQSVGKTNAPGLFAHNVRKGLWPHITQADEDAANDLIKRHLFDFRPEQLSRDGDRFGTRRAVQLSDDARAFKSIQEAFAKMPGKPSPRGHFIRQGWTPERVDLAAVELEAAKVEQYRANATGGQP